MTNPYRQFVETIIDAERTASKLPLGGLEAPPRPVPPADAPTALMFSPHPDDECIVGTLPLRLMRECGVRAVNVAVTLGSRKDRRGERRIELRNACSFLGFELVDLCEEGLEHVNEAGRNNEPSAWAGKVARVQAVLEQWRPQAVFMPHREDWNSTHEGTHWLVADALERMPNAFECTIVETEFWHPIRNPNLMIEVAPDLVAELVGATTFHVGEVRRNPYHLSLPAWMRDNVRRGAEIVGGQGGDAPAFEFATLYQVSLWRNGERRPAEPPLRIVGARDRPQLPHLC